MCRAAQTAMEVLLGRGHMKCILEYKSVTVSRYTCPPANQWCMGPIRSRESRLPG